MSEETIVSEVVAASVGGAISASILYPLEVLKTKMQAERASIVVKSNDDNNDNNEPNDEKNTSNTKINNKNSTVNNNNNNNNNSNNSNNSGGGGGGGGMISFASNLYRNEGYSVFVRGIETSAFQSALEKSLYFFAYTFLKDCYYTISGNNNINTATNLALGCMAEWAHLPITLPVDAWTTQIQTSTTNETPIAILLTMLSDRNCNFYKGISAYYLLCFKPALQYTIYEQVKKIVIQNRQRQNNNNSQNSSLSSLEAFVLGMIARTVSTVFVFPFLRAKVLLQAQKNSQTFTSSSSSLSTNAIDGNSENTGSNLSTTTGILFQEWNKAGISGLYKGIGPELTRGIFSAALMLMIKEKIAEIVRRLLLPTKSKHINQS